MSANENIIISDDDIFYAQMDSPENVRYFINRMKSVVNSSLRKQWEDDCYKLVAQYNAQAYPVILASAQVIFKVRNYKSTDELTSFFDNLMINMPADFLFDEFKTLLSKYSADYFQILNIFLFNLTDVSVKVKNYIKNK